MNAQHRTLLAGTALLAMLAAREAGVKGQAGAVASTRPESVAPAWAPPRTADGQPDIQGTWNVSPTGTFDLTDPKTGGGRIQELLDLEAGKVTPPRRSRVIDPADGEIPYQPWARAHQQETEKHVDHPTKREHIDPQARCLPGAVPRSLFHSANRIVQTPGFVVFMTANNHASRIVPIDGRPHIGDGIKLWMGSSRGRWEGNTLVIDVRNQNVKGRFDMVGNFATPDLQVLERYTIIDANTIDYQATFTDPNAFTRPWTVGAKLVRREPSQEPYGNEFWEDACHEGERSAEHMVLSPAETGAP
jgi:hypothetical protein